MNSLTSSMFESIKSALTKENTSGSNKQKDFLRTEPGNTYTVRLLPNLKDPTKTFLHYYSHGWNSFSTGQLITLVSPTTWNERDPIAEERYRVLRNGTETEKEKAKAIVRTERWLVNCYVVNDPVNEENNNKIKVLRFGRQLHKIIKEAMEGEDADELGARIFDLFRTPLFLFGDRSADELGSPLVQHNVRGLCVLGNVLFDACGSWDRDRGSQESGRSLGDCE